MGQANALAEWPKIKRGVASELVATESLRTLDRLRLRCALSDRDIASRRSTILALVATLELVAIDTAVLERASQPMPTELGTLDAIHLATALLWNETSEALLTMATHDIALGIGAAAHGIRVVGIPKTQLT